MCSTSPAMSMTLASIPDLLSVPQGSYSFKHLGYPISLLPFLGVAKRVAGSAAELADRGVIGVYPVSGWWKEQPKRDRSGCV